MDLFAFSYWSSQGKQPITLKSVFSYCFSRNVLGAPLPAGSRDTENALELLGSSTGRGPGIGASWTLG